MKRDEVIALSIRQPWAWLIANGHKDVENRTWRTSYRGPVLIHTGQRIDEDAEFARYLAGEIGVTIPDELPMGGIVGMARMVGCVTESDSPWFAGPFGFVLIDARPLPFRACRGQLGFFHTAPPGAQE